MDKSILVIGETCVDVFIYGSTDRLAPEAPAPVFVPEKTKNNLGMAGNVFENVLSLGYEANIVTNQNFNSVTKTRYVHRGTNSLLLRVDSGEDKVKPLDDLNLDQLSNFDAILISDYCKGFLTEENISSISKSHPLVFLDTKKKLGSWCKDVFLIKVNSAEFHKSNADSLEESIRNKIIHTAGPHGCFYQGTRYPVKKVHIKDLSGAGDTFFAALAVKYLECNSITESIVFANACATQAVQRRGVFQSLSADS